jgi:hypothetical protein|tara:strand:- start:194 stop:454 length:261 start_codon:yes stop_codon:yes gene_type:complete
MTASTVTIKVAGPAGENPLTVTIIHDGDRVYIIPPEDENGQMESVGSCSGDYHKLEDRGLWQFSPAGYGSDRQYGSFRSRPRWVEA